MSSAKEGSSKQSRIMLWGTPRCLSTAFARSMGARGDTEVFWEPYFACFGFGPDRQPAPPEWTDMMPASMLAMFNDKYTYRYIKGLLEEDHPNGKVLFVKGMVQGIHGKYDMLASGYKHSFLIRHPKKVFRSIENMSKGFTKMPVSPTAIYKNIFQDLEQFYEHVQTLGQPLPPILDADDVIAHPEQVLTKYCDAMGIAFTPKMLAWSTVEASQLNWHCTDVGPISNKDMLDISSVLKNAMESQGFGTVKPLPPEKDLSAEVLECAKHAMPVYERLYALRIKP